jgi:hypothetical protein
MPRRRVPWPAMPELCIGEEETRSPNSVPLRLKPVVPTLAMLFEMTARSVCEALRPESAV